MLDIDHFKPLNDQLGHAVGDTALKAVGSALRASLRRDDFVARLGGDEFGLLLADLDAASAGAVLQRFRSSACVCSNVPTGQPPLTVSLGYCLCTASDQRSTSEIFAAADAALRRAKAAGRNRLEKG